MLIVASLIDVADISPPSPNAVSTVPVLMRVNLNVKSQLEFSRPAVLFSSNALMVRLPMSCMLYCLLIMHSPDTSTDIVLLSTGSQLTVMLSVFLENEFSGLKLILLAGAGNDIDEFEALT